MAGIGVWVENNDTEYVFELKRETNHAERGQRQCKGGCREVTSIAIFGNLTRIRPTTNFNWHVASFCRGLSIIGEQCGVPCVPYPCQTDSLILSCPIRGNVLLFVK